MQSEANKTANELREFRRHDKKRVKQFLVAGCLLGLSGFGASFLFELTPWLETSTLLVPVFAIGAMAMSIDKKRFDFARKI
ncbi:hypothetical protein MUY35_03985 [Aliiroseovarius sp. S1339]|uniref:hypothetical protein n=1 Tax=Aliiroseovarius sp. S1339 TaxID=2936990 RepID=UPI0020BD5539|nr:hypothetical protein [Aliiroseovarius sp. S1339]MCK8463006.1 hypothetical protein [Aliiroseovarius sp. S1339]